MKKRNVVLQQSKHMKIELDTSYGAGARRCKENKRQKDREENNK